MDSPRKKAQVHVYMDKELRDIAVKDCLERGVKLTDVITELVADFYARPDLRVVPRKVVGRKLGTKMKKRK